MKNPSAWPPTAPAAAISLSEPSLQPATLNSQLLCNRGVSFDVTPLNALNPMFGRFARLSFPNHAGQTLDPDHTIPAPTCNGFALR